MAAMIDANDIYSPVVRDGFEGWSCKRCGSFLVWWQLFSHYAMHLQELLPTTEAQPEDELTD